jgi:hypothetical protein
MKSASVFRLFLTIIALSLPITTTSFQFPSLFQQASPKQRLKDNSIKAKELLQDLEGLIRRAPKNGIDTPSELEEEILDTLQRLEGINPTPKPVRNLLKMNGFWKMRWTNFEPAAPSSGKLGPFVGDVFQDISIPDGGARNILRIDFPPIAGELKADVDIVNDNTVAITFVSVANKLAGIFPAGPKVEFEPGKEVRLWEHVYLDDTYRILYARRREEDALRGFAYVMKRADDERFETGV